jgi:hypothetical protein
MWEFRESGTALGATRVALVCSLDPCAHGTTATLMPSPLAVLSNAARAERSGKRSVTVASTLIGGKHSFGIL